jgi:hypothetical protein
MKGSIFSSVTRRAALAAAGASLVSAAACSDAATAPGGDSSGGAHAISAYLQVPQGVWVSVQVVNTAGNHVGDAQVHFSADRLAAKLVLDNSAADADDRVGYVKTLLPAGASGYLACLAYVPEPYGADPGTCKTIRSSGLSIDLRKLVVHKRPTLSFNMKKQNGTLAPGATVSVTGPDGFAAMIADGAANDGAAGNNGLIYLVLPKAGVYTWCEIVPPTDHVLISPSCATQQYDWDIQYVKLVTHQPVISAEYPF